MYAHHNCGKTAQFYHTENVSGIKCVLLILFAEDVDKRKDAHSKASRCIFATFHCKCTIKRIILRV
jgi:hypothetical protein